MERWLGTLRARTSRLVRRAYSFSKHAENHLDALHLFITTYNLAILHKATVNWSLPNDPTYLKVPGQLEEA